ncbi:fused MFS/spermidine synthase [Catenovulum sediminis]|uniref:Fused MFS/spermidine synthase n=1 Tax=Catenovulum sediminis TaxID=1740262 RepID=A0ABV1RNJ3_9ALTE
MLVELKKSLSKAQLLAYKKDLTSHWRVEQNKRYRWLTLDATVQSVMDRKNTDLLTFPHQFPLKGLIAELTEHASVLELGLGGGGNFRYLKSQCPTAEVDIVEQSPIVIEWFNEYFNPQSLIANIMQADAQQYILDNEKRYDLIITDLFVSQSSILETLTADYFTKLKQSLTHTGFAYINFLPETDFEAHWVKASLEQAGLNVMWAEKIIGFRNWVYLISARFQPST